MNGILEARQAPQTKWYELLIEPTLAKEKAAGAPYHYQIKAVDDLGAMAQAESAKERDAASKRIDINSLVASITPCSDC
ncbi:hypothetical protein HZB78_00435 [Candidatus Collierbacteria bacterium]|nr:hypothetical protein [Candidatus Collierbacteria bacterium]